jgi:hypothetical protein
MPAQDPNERLFQIDGTDVSGTDSYNPDSIARIASTPYYRFLCWLRDCAAYSQWQDLSLQDAAGHTLLANASITTLAQTTLPPRFTLRGYLQRPDVGGNLLFTGAGTVQMSIAPDARTLLLNGKTQFYPQDVQPYLAEAGWTMTRTYLWSIAALAVLVLLGLAAMRGCLLLGPAIARVRTWLPNYRRWWVTWSWPHLSLLAVLIILLELLGIATFDYQQLPRIYDASAYYFQAKILSTGNLWAPTPPAAQSLNFLGPFMVSTQGRWFAQYPPGAPLAIALGMVFRLPWAVEPALGAVSVLLMLRLTRRWYGKTTALLIIPLVAFSPFFLFLASSFLSHMVVLTALLLFLEGIDQLATTGKWQWAALAGTGAGYAGLTRELDALIFILVVCLFYGADAAPRLWRGVRRGCVRAHDVARVVAALALPLALLTTFYFFYDWRTTGNAFLTPRAVLNSSDSWGFGPGKGWYNQHTPAAGFFIIENLLTSLLIHLYGWPYYLTLCFFFVPLVTLRLKKQDILLYTLAATFLLAYAGYFFHGIAFGPRYIFASLPAYIILTARGLVEVASLVAGLLSRITGDARARGAALFSAGLALLALMTCNFSFYLPRQFSLYYDYLEPGYQGGLAYDRVHPSWMHHAIVLTDNAGLYGDVFFPLNDPDLRSDIIYARVVETRNVAGLMRAYPHRSLYWARTDRQMLRFQRMGVLARPVHQCTLRVDGAGQNGPGFSGLAIGNHGTMFVADANTGTILRFNTGCRQTGRISTDVAPGALFHIRWSRGYIYWLNPATGMLWRADGTGTQRRSMLREPCRGCGDFAITPSGDVVMAQTAGGALFRYSPRGVITATTPSGVGLRQPTSVAVTANGHVFIYDAELHRAVEFDATLRRHRALPFGSGANGSLTLFAAAGNWLVGNDPAAQSLIAYNEETAETRAVSVTEAGDLLPVQGYGLAWDGHQLLLASGFPGGVAVVNTGAAPW